MKRLVLASAVSAIFAAPVALAQSAPPVPTLDKVLEASGLSVSGYLDFAYSHSDRNLETAFSDRVFDSQNNSFVLHQFGLSVAKQPKEGFGGLVNITAGKDAQVIHSFPESSGASNSLFDITQAFAQYASGPLTVMAGKYVTLQGSEVIWTPTNVNFSHSILFGAIPFTHTGLRASYALGDSATLYAGVNNGWDQLQDSNRSKTVELGATFTPIKPLSITVSDYNGKESATGTPSASAAQGNRNSLNAVATYALSDSLSFGVEGLKVTQKNFSTGTGTKDAEYTGFAGYVTFMMSPKWRAVVRAESFNDKDGFHFGTAGTKYKEGTLTVSYLASSSFEMRGEVRRDTATNAVFQDFDGGMKKSLMTFGLQALYKF